MKKEEGERSRGRGVEGSRGLEVKRSRGLEVERVSAKGEM